MVPHEATALDFERAIITRCTMLRVMGPEDTELIMAAPVDHPITLQASALRLMLGMAGDAGITRGYQEEAEFMFNTPDTPEDSDA